MKKNIFIILSLVVTALILNGCGHGHDVKSGTFSGPLVEGIHYSTKTFSGETDASGRFSYEKGEIVTFSIGDLVLGRIKGGDVISPFDLCNLDPVEDEKELQAILKKSLSLSYIRLINIVVLLQSLDQGTGSGVFISDAVRKLVSAESFNLKSTSNDFSLQLRQFYLKARDAGVVIGLVAPESAVNRLYDGLSVKPGYKQINRVSIDHDDDDIEDNYISFDYNAAGKLVAKVRDLIGLNSTETWQYNDDNQLRFAGIEMTTEDGGQLLNMAATMNNTYDDAGRLTKMELQETVNENSTLTTILYHYDEDGRVELENEVKTEGDDATMSSATSYNYDAHGNPERFVRESTYTRGDDVQTVSQTIDYTYNEKNQRTEETSTDVRTNNGVSQTLNRLVTITYNPDGQAAQSEMNSSGDGRNRSTIAVISYNEFGQPLSQAVTSNDIYLDQTRRSYMASEIVYNEYGFLETVEETQETNVNDVLQQRSFESYDANHNIVKLERSYGGSKLAVIDHNDSKDVPQSIDSTFTYICDDIDNIVVARGDTDSDGEPEIIQSFVYDDTGYMLSRGLLGETYDSSYTYTYNEALIAVDDVDRSTFEDIYDIRFDSDFYFSYDREIIDGGFTKAMRANQ